MAMDVAIMKAVLARELRAEADAVEAQIKAEEEAPAGDLQADEHHRMRTVAREFRNLADRFMPR